MPYRCLLPLPTQVSGSEHSRHGCFEYGDLVRVLTLHAPSDEARQLARELANGGGDDSEAVPCGAVIESRVPGSIHPWSVDSGSPGRPPWEWHDKWQYALQQGDFGRAAGPNSAGPDSATGLASTSTSHRPGGIEPRPSEVNAMAAAWSHRLSLLSLTGWEAERPSTAGVVADDLLARRVHHSYHPTTAPATLIHAHSKVHNSRATIALPQRPPRQQAPNASRGRKPWMWSSSSSLPHSIPPCTPPLNRSQTRGSNSMLRSNASLGTQARPSSQSLASLHHANGPSSRTSLLTVLAMMDDEGTGKLSQGQLKRVLKM